MDLDSVACYWGIHGLAGAPPIELRHVVLRRALPRFRALFDDLGVRATFFVIGSDLLDDAEGAALLATLAAEGHELANHTHTHPYRFSTLPPAEIAREIDEAHASLTALTGQPPVGFRAPGYAVSADVMTVLAARGYRYDSSVFPSWPYYLAKAAVMGALAAQGRPSASYLDRPAVLLAPPRPYHPHARDPYRPGDEPMWEVPIAVTPFVRFPVIGTSVVTLPGWARRVALAGALRATTFNLELHGIDLADAREDGLPPALVARQPDLRRDLAFKRAALGATLEEARAAGFRFLPLRELVETLARRA